MSLNYYYKISENQVTLNDNWVSTVLPSTSTTYNDLRFYHLELGAPNSQANNPLLSLEFLLDENKTFYSRQVQCLTDVLSNTGGLMTFIFAALSILLGPIQEHLFHTSIMRRIFFVNYTNQASGQSVKIRPEQEQENNTNVQERGRRLTEPEPGQAVKAARSMLIDRPQIQSSLSIIDEYSPKKKNNAGASSEVDSKRFFFNNESQSNNQVPFIKLHSTNDDQLNEAFEQI